MSLKIFIAILFLFSFVFTSLSHADEPVLKKTKNEEDVVKILSVRCTEKDFTKTRKAQLKSFLADTRKMILLKRQLLLKIYA